MLLAKSDPKDPDRSLEAHTKAVRAAAATIRIIWPELPELLDDIALYHDFGKAASGFQQMLQPGGEAWHFRHEVLSAAVFRDQFDISNAAILRGYLALLTHHKNLGSRKNGGTVDSAFFQCQSGDGTEWPSKWNELQVEELRGLFPCVLSNWEFKADKDSPADDVPLYIRAVRPAFEDIEQTQLRGALVAADHLASSGVGNTIRGSNVTLAAVEAYMQKYCRAEDGTDWQGWKPIQEDAARIHGSAALIAPTGAGKTEAALRWALANRKRHERIFYVLPYQVSINAMAERISRAFPDAEGRTRVSENDNVTILHSNTDLAYLQDALNDEIPLEQAVRIARAGRDAARKIYSPIKVTTVYQLLDIFFGRKFFEVGLLELTDSLVIFDEIHAYDGHTLGLIHILLEYLQKLNARIFIMTATLPTSLKDTLLEAAGITNEIGLADDDPLLSEVRRKIVMHRDKHIDELIDEITAVVKAGKSTVVVCNTVDKAIQMRELLSALDPLLIHSRFTIGDRARREQKENIEAYALVISTQVIEVSLDVSFDVMFTEVAPADGLLQRFGRVNRHGEPNPDRPGMCHIACADDSGSKLIYGIELLNRTKDNVPTQPLTFEIACKWIGDVYPDGLPSDQLKEMELKRAVFRDVVANLRPMLDAQDVDLEKNLFQSAQVVPARYEKEWQSLKEAGKHMEAKRLIVNVDARVWRNAKRKAADAGREAERTIPLDRRKQIVALFEYVEDAPDSLDGTGLRLDRPLSADYDINDRCC